MQGCGYAGLWVCRGVGIVGMQGCGCTNKFFFFAGVWVRDH